MRWILCFAILSLIGAAPSTQSSQAPSNDTFSVQQENDRLRAEVKSLQLENDSLKAEISALREGKPKSADAKAAKTLKIDLGAPEQDVVKLYQGKLRDRGEKMTNVRGDVRHIVNVYDVPLPAGLKVRCEKGKVFDFNLPPTVGMTEDDLLYYNRNAEQSFYSVKSESETTKRYAGEGGYSVEVRLDTHTVAKVVQPR